MNIATVYGHEHDRHKPVFHTHHVFWDLTLTQMGHAVTHFTWAEFPDMPRTFDVYFFIDFNPALFKLERGRFKNAILYWNDSFHFTLAYVAQAAEQFDQAYMSEKGSCDHLASLGYRVNWLPAAYYPGLYRPLDRVPKVHHYGFIGQQDPHVVRKGDTRRSFLEKITKLEGVHGYIGWGVYGEAVNLVYNESQVLFDRTIWYNIGTRIFEVIGSGGFFLMNRLPKFSRLDDIATDGVHYVSYDDSFQDFEKKLRYYMEHDEEREMIAHAGLAHFRDRHTYRHRAKAILKDLHL